MPDDPVPALKQQLADEILAVIGHLNPFIAADILGIDEARMSDLRHGRAGRFSVDRLVRLLATLDRRVDLTVVNVGHWHPRWFHIARERKAARQAAKLSASLAAATLTRAPASPTALALLAGSPNPCLARPTG